MRIKRIIFAMKLILTNISMFIVLLSSVFGSPLVPRSIAGVSSAEQLQYQPPDPPNPPNPPNALERVLRNAPVMPLATTQLQNATALGRYVTAPSTLPVISVTTPASGTAPGYIFLANFFAPNKPTFLLILDDEGELVYYKASTIANLVFADFKVQPKGSLTYFEGFNNVTINGVFQEMNSSYEMTQTWQPGIPYPADVHDLHLLPNGRALIMIYDIQSRDLSAYGGLTNTQFIDTLIQEVDADRNVDFTWRASDHIPITNTYESLTASFLDHSHGNAVELDYDGNILLSSRHLSEITKIDRLTGQIIWRLGGKENQFTFTNDDGFSYQHDIRRLPNGHITLFDNGNQRVPPQYSRAVEYEIDESSKVITRVWEYRNTPEVYGSFMGNVQRLPNGNSMIGWGGPRSVGTEVGPDGTKRFELELNSATDGFIYRVFRFPWVGTPATTPTLVLTDVVSGFPNLYYSWNGATEIASYRVESGETDGLFTDVVTQTKSDFEDSTPLSTFPANACYYRVMPIDKNGLDTRYSDTVVKQVVPCIPEVEIAGLSAANDSPKKIGENVRFTASITAGTNVSYSWNFGDGALGSGITPTHSYADAGSYTATVTATNSLTTPVVATTVVTITDIAIAGLAAANDSPKTIGENVQFTASITAGTNVSYSWDFGDGVLGSGITPTHSYAEIGIYTATVTATNSLTTLVVATTVVTITDVAIAGLAVANDSPKAIGENVQFTASITAGTNVIYGWDFGDGALGSGITPTHSYAEVGIYTATVTATNSLTAPVVATTVVTITDIAIAGLDAANTSPKMTGEGVQFTASITAGTNVSYSWDFGAGALGSGIMPTHSYTVAGSYTATVTATNGLGAVAASTRVTITVLPNNDLAGAFKTQFSGNLITYTLVITNENASRPAPGVVVSGSIPANTALVSTNGTSVPTGGDFGRGYVQTSPLTLAPDAHVTLTWTVRVTAYTGAIATLAHVTGESMLNPIQIPSVQIQYFFLPILSSL